MALKTTSAVKAPAPPADDTVLLELAFYKRLTRQRTTYVSGQPYRFKREDAYRLLAELDHQRPIWRIFQPKPVVRKAVDGTVEQPVVDATHLSVERKAEPIFGSEAVMVTPKGKRIEVGTDDEISDILNAPDEASPDDVTV